MYKLILIRHGQSEWNLSNQFTGWTDVDLTEQGIEEAKEAGRILRKEPGLDIRYTYTSYLKRAIKTLNYVLEEMDRMWLPVYKTWRRNEKHYGALQGQNKKEAVAVFGEEQVNKWRRSYDVQPEPLADDDPRHPKFDIRYQDIKFKAARPATESLMDATKRIIPLWNVNIVESLRQYKQVLVVAHGNSIRGIIKFMKNMSNEDIVKLNIPTGVPYLLELDSEMQVISDRYLGLSEDELKAKQDGVANQTKA